MNLAVEQVTKRVIFSFCIGSSLASKYLSLSLFACSIIFCGETHRSRMTRSKGTNIFMALGCYYGQEF